MKNVFKKIVVLFLVSVSFFCTGICVYAADAVFEYEDNGSFITITGCNADVTGNIVIPSMIDGKPVYEIGEYAFEGCTGINSIIIEEGIDTIYEGAFERCGILENVVIPDSVWIIERGIFDGTFINNLSIPIVGYGMVDVFDFFDGVDVHVKNLTITNEVSIPKSTFAYCESLEYVSLNEGITYIGQGAFISCTSLKSIVLPDSVDTIENKAFYDTAYYNDEANWTDGILYLGNHIICADKSIVNPVIADGTITIGGLAFSGCEDITKISIPDSVRHINISAFNGCTNLDAISLGAGIENISRYAFDDTAYFNDASNWEEGFLYLDDWLISARNDITNAYIKEGTLYIADEVFAYEHQVESILMPDSVLKIGTGLFCENPNIKNVRLSSSITEIPIETFYECANLKQITIPDSVEDIGNLAFSCSGLESVIIPDSVVRMGRGVFGECAGLKNVTLSKNITEMIRMFTECTSLESIIIPKNVTYLYRNFNGCTSLKELVLLSDNIELCLESLNDTVVYGYMDSSAEWDIYGYSEYIYLDGDVTIDGINAIAKGDKIDVSVDFSQKYMSHKVLVGLYDSDNSLLGISSVEPCGDNNIGFDNNPKASFVKVFVMKSPLNLIPVASKSMNISK